MKKSKKLNFEISEKVDVLKLAKKSKIAKSNASSKIVKSKNASSNIVKAKNASSNIVKSKNAKNAGAVQEIRAQLRPRRHH